MKPTFSVGIPTFNRVDLLQEAVASALTQSQPGIEVIVSDNASTDGTEEWCRSLADSRVKYVRSSENRGALKNFANCVDAATGDYFSWLQDDDVIFADFAVRAVEALERHHADAYLAIAIRGHSPSFVFWDALYAPPVPMDWVRQIPRPIDAGIVAALSLFVSVAIPPVIAFRRKFLLSHVPAMTDERFPLYSERLLLVSAAAAGRVLVAPHVAGVFREHNAQLHKSQLDQRGDAQRQWEEFVRALDRLVDDRRVDLSCFVEYLKCVPGKPLRDWVVAAARRTPMTPTEQAVYAMVRTEAMRRPDLGVVCTATQGHSWCGMVKNAARELCPPIVWRIARQCWRSVRPYGDS